MLELINSIRKTNKLSLLELSDELNMIAQDHCEVLVRHNTLTHRNPETGSELLDRMSQSSLMAKIASENIGSGRSISSAFEKLINSPKHLENILEPDITHVGLGIQRRGEHIFVVQDFIHLIPRADATDIHPFLISQINSTRKANHLADLIEDPNLSKIAKEQTKRMIEHDSLLFPNLNNNTTHKIYCISTPDISNAVFDFNLYDRRYTRIGLYFQQAKTAKQVLGMWWGVAILE